MARRVCFRFPRAALLSLAVGLAWPALAQDAAAPGVVAAAGPVAAGASGAAATDAGTAAELSRLRAEVQQQRDLVLLMRQRLADADSARAWLPWVGLALVLTSALAAWLGLGVLRQRPRQAPAARIDQAPVAEGARSGAMASASDGGRDPGAGAPQQERAHSDSVLGGLGRLRGDAQPGMAAGQGLSPAVFSPTTTAAAMGPYEADPATLTRPAVAAPRPPEPAPRISELSLSLSGQAPRAVTVEELLDLEQQVDFFMVLGQEDAAIDLLVSHIRGSGGTSALPYLKLMEVYRHQGNAEDYERTRSRFNQRFNGQAPEWSADPEAGRTLEDYPEVLERLQDAWALPFDAMAELGRQMFLREQGEPFDLPAYRELLLLDSVARDLSEQEPVQSATPVDLLLPLEDELGDTTSPRPHLGLFSDDATGGRTANWARMNEQPAAREQASMADRTMSLRSADLAPPRIDLDMALDIDLTEFSPAPREFTQPAAFNDVDLSRSDFGAFDDPPVPPRRGG